MRGRFTREAAAEQWCERRLLSRIHHYTLKRLRAEIEPVAARDFLRFLLDWQHVSADARMAGPKAADLARWRNSHEGFEAAAERPRKAKVLAGRLADYEPHWLDGQRGSLATSPGCGCVPATARYQWPRKAGAGADDADHAARRGVMPAFGRHCPRTTLRHIRSPRAQLVADAASRNTARRSLSKVN